MLAVLQVVVIYILARFRSCFPSPFVMFLDVKRFCVCVCGEHSSSKENAQVEIQIQFYEQSWGRAVPYFSGGGIIKSFKKKTTVLFESVWLGLSKSGLN